MRPFEEIIVEHGPVVMRVCRALLGPADADDAWSETFLAALRNYPQLRPGSNVRGWLVTIAHSKAIDQIRGASRRPTPSELPDIGASDTHPDELDGELVDALRRLPFKQRHAVIYRYLADLAYREIAGLLECSESAARRSAADGIAALRTHYGKRAAS